MRPLVVLTICAALGSGVVAGVFFAFSTFVMPALARLPPEQGIAAMQSINVTALNRWLMSALFGTAGLCVLLAVASLKSRSDPGAGLRLGGSALYLVGAILVTIACNVPRNEALAAVRPDAAEAAQLWPHYLTEWVAWNHVRTGAALAAAALLILAQLPPPSLLRPPQSSHPVATTNRYADINLRTKEAALRQCAPPPGVGGPKARAPVWRNDEAMLAWLASL